jgi:hypothetical protein
MEEKTKTQFELDLPVGYSIAEVSFMHLYNLT